MATEILRPNGVGDLNTLYASPNVDHYLNVDEESEDGDDTYNYTSSTNRNDLYALPSTGIAAIDTINSVTLKTYIKKFDSTHYQGYVGIKTESTEYWGDKIDFETDYTLESRVYNNNPNTGIAWTVAQLNALQIGAKSYVSVAGLKITQIYVEIDYTEYTPQNYDETGLTQVILVAQGVSDFQAHSETGLTQVILVVVLAPVSGEHIETGLLQVILATVTVNDSQGMQQSAVGHVILAVISVSDYTDYGDWNLLVSGKDSSGKFKLWTLIYGDGGDVAGGTWSALKEIASAESALSYQYHRPFMAKPDVYRSFYIEKFTGVEAYARPFWTHSILGATFLDNLWREPVPFNLASDYGLAICFDDTHCWLTSPDGVWSSPRAVETLDLTADVLSLRLEQNPELGSLGVELFNGEGGYSSLPSPLAIGCQVEVSPGYITTNGNEVSPSVDFLLEAYEHISAGGKSMLALIAFDAWYAINVWRARHQFRWNNSSNELTIKGMLEFVLARVGLALEVVSESTAITTTYHEFTINPNNRGLTVIRKLLSFVPDVIFFEGQKAYLVNPQSADSSGYSYVTPQTSEHPLIEGRYRTGAWAFNRLHVEGLTGGGSLVLSDNFEWDEIDVIFDRYKQLYQTNLDSLAKAQAIATAYFREAEIESVEGFIRVPVNCGQQLYDVIDITDSRAGLTAEKKRVRSLAFRYHPSKAIYDLRIELGVV